MKSVLNFRDFGNYPTMDGRHIRKGLLYRSGELDKASVRDMTLIQSLKIKTIIDLRPANEHRKGYSGVTNTRSLLIPFDFDKLTRERLKPFIFKRNSANSIISAIDSVYDDMVDTSIPQLGEILKVLSSKDAYPVLINCRGGKDRTGFVVAVIHLALGVETELVIQDYLKTNESLSARVNRATTLAKWITLGIYPSQNLHTIFTAQERYIRTVMDKITHKYGGIESYLKSAGIQKEDLEQVRSILLT